MSEDFYTSSILPYASIIVKICRAYTSTEEDFEDYYQEVCLQIWRSRNNFKEQSEWSTWIYRLSLNVCMTLLKQKKKRGQTYFASDYIPSAPETGNNEEIFQLLYDAIKQLSEVDRGIILLYLEEQSYKDIAEVMGTNTNNIGVRIKRIKERLKKQLDGKIN